MLAGIASLLIAAMPPEAELMVAKPLVGHVTYTSTAARGVGVLEIGISNPYYTVCFAAVRALLVAGSGRAWVELFDTKQDEHALLMPKERWVWSSARARVSGEIRALLAPDTSVDRLEVAAGRPIMVDGKMRCEVGGFALEQRPLDEVTR